MSHKPVITVIGAASTTFDPKVLRGILNHPQVGGATVRFVDVDEGIIVNLPQPLAAFCRRDVDQVELIVEAAVHGDRRLVLQAMLLDPVADSVRVAERVLEEMMNAQEDYLPQFQDR